VGLALAILLVVIYFVIRGSVKAKRPELN